MVCYYDYSMAKAFLGNGGGGLQMAPIFGRHPQHMTYRPQAQGGLTQEASTHSPSDQYKGKYKGKKFWAPLVQRI